MTAHELMIKTNRHIIKGGELTEAQKKNIVLQLLSARSNERAKRNFYKGVRYPGNKDSGGGGRMYPEYYIPPFDYGRKLQTVIPMTPKTHILSANAYELEILRLLYVFEPEDPVTEEMVKKTLERLKTACFGRGCPQGECFHSALPVLRFLAAVSPDDPSWINSLIFFFDKHIEEKLRGKRVHGNTLWYYWLCLSELPYTAAEAELIKYREQIRGRLNKSAVMNSEADRTHHPVLYCVLRNCLSRFPEYAFLKERQPYVNEKDGRLHFDME